MKPKRIIKEVYFQPGVQIDEVTQAPVTVVLCNDSTLWGHVLGGHRDRWTQYPEIPQPPPPDRFNCVECEHYFIQKGPMKEKLCMQSGRAERLMYHENVECVFKPKEPSE